MSHDSEASSLHGEIRELREEVSEIKRMLIAIAPTIALSAGDTETWRHVLELIRERVGAKRPSVIWQEDRSSVRALDLMADRAKELDALDLAQYLTE